MSRPTLEDGGSYSPSSLALNLGTVSATDFEDIKYTIYQGEKSKILIIFTEQKNLEMKNGKMFSTGNHPVEALVPMLHLKNAGFDFEIVVIPLRRESLSWRWRSALQLDLGLTER